MSAAPIHYAFDRVDGRPPGRAGLALCGRAHDRAAVRAAEVTCSECRARLNEREEAIDRILDYLTAIAMKRGIR